MKKTMSSISTIVLLIGFITVIPSCRTTGKTRHFYYQARITKIMSYSRLELKLERQKRFITVKMIGVSIPGTRALKNYFRKFNIPEKEKRGLYMARKRAAHFLEKQLTVGDVVRFEYGFNRHDKYRNTLVYLYLPNHSMLNEKYIRLGYSLPYIDEDNIKYAPQFHTALDEAIKDKNGLWRILENITFPHLTPTKIQSVAKGKPGDYRISGMDTVSVMTYNVENLFNTRHDPGKSDYQYIPLADKNTKKHKQICKDMRRGFRACMKLDWSERVLNAKMKQLSRVILSYNRGKGADIIIFQEVENFKVLNRLRKKYLKSAGYHTAVLIEGGDFRGIDIGIISRLPIIGTPRLHSIPFKETTATRGILETALQLPNGKKLTILGLHFPSQMHSVNQRIQAVKYLNKLYSKLPGGSLVIAAGDCNITGTEEKKIKVLKKYASDDWLISYRLNTMNYTGSTYYEGTKKWSFFDIILFSKVMSPQATGPGWRIVPASIKVHIGYRGQITREGTPHRFDKKHFTGVSDHLPVVAEIRLYR